MQTQTDSAGQLLQFTLLMPWGRVGSNMVAAALTEGAKVHIDNEPTTRIRTVGQQKGHSKEQMRRNQRDQLERFLARRGRDHAVGLKLSYMSLLVPQDYLGRLADSQVRLVLMTRENALKCAVSQLRALARTHQAVTGAAAQWQSPWAVLAQEPKPGPERIDVEKAIRLARVFQTQHDRMLAKVDAVFGGRWHQVEYRALCARPDETIAGVFTYIGLEPPDRIRIPHRKATSDRLSEDITNYDDFATRVTDAGLGRFLSDGG